MNAEDARLFRERWAAVAAIEEQERRAATIKERWIKLNALYRIGAALELRIPDDEAEVFLRWSKIKDRLM